MFNSDVVFAYNYRGWIVYEAGSGLFHVIQGPRFLNLNAAKRWINDQLC
jgi:hypothetical protein